MTQAAAAAMLGTLQGLSSSAGQIFAGLNSSYSGNLNNINSNSPYIMAPGSNPNAPIWIPNPDYQFAEGGTLIANKSTLAMFGERGAEAATFTPLNRTGRNVGQVFGDVGGGGNSSLALSIQLSDGLIAEIVDTSLDNVAVAFERESRSKR